MRNVRFTVTLEDGAVEHVHGDLSGSELIHRLVPGERSSRPTSLTIEAVTIDRRMVRIVIPYGNVDQVHASVVPAPPFQNGDVVRNLATGARGMVLSCGLNGPAMVKVAERIETWNTGEMRLL